MSLKSEIEAHTGETILSGEIPQYVGWINEIQNVLVHLVDESHADLFSATHPVPFPGGLDISLMRFIRPFKDGLVAPIYPSHMALKITDPNYTGIYRASPLNPAAVIKDHKLFVYPLGGHTTAVGVSPVSTLNETGFPTMPPAFKSASVYYAAIQGLKHKLATANQSKALSSAPVLPDPVVVMPNLTIEAFTETLSQSSLPTAPSDPSISADQAGEPSVGSPNITSPELSGGGAGEIYQKENPSLTFTIAEQRQLDDDIEMLNGELEVLRRRLELANTKMQDELNRVNTLIAGFQSKVQHSLEQGRLTLSASDSQAGLRLNRELRNAENKLNAAIKERELILGRYNTQLNGILGENQNKIAEFGARTAVWIKKNELNSLVYTSTIQFALTKYQTEVSAELQHYQNSLAHFASNTQILDSKIQGFITNIAILTENFTRAVQAYMASVASETYVSAPVDPEVPA